MKILIIEDSETCGQCLEMNICLAFPTVEIVWHKTLMGGIQEVDKNVDFVILDLSLPDSMDPFMTIARFRPFMNVMPTIVISGTENPMAMLESIDSGALVFIHKSKLDSIIKVFSDFMRVA